MNIDSAFFINKLDENIIKKSYLSVEEIEALKNSKALTLLKAFKSVYASSSSSIKVKLLRILEYRRETDDCWLKDLFNMPRVALPGDPK